MTDFNRILGSSRVNVTAHACVFLGETRQGSNTIASSILQYRVDSSTSCSLSYFHTVGCDRALRKASSAESIRPFASFNSRRDWFSWALVATVRSIYCIRSEWCFPNFQISKVCLGSWELGGQLVCQCNTSDWKLTLTRHTSATAVLNFGKASVVVTSSPTLVIKSWGNCESQDSASHLQLLLLSFWTCTDARYLRTTRNQPCAAFFLRLSSLSALRSGETGPALLLRSDYIRFTWQFLRMFVRKIDANL